MERQFVKAYFDGEGADAWIEDGYGDHPHDYPVGYHRSRIVASVLGQQANPLQVADLGCGGGHLARILAKQGHHVLGMDRSKRMIEIARASLAELPEPARQRLQFDHTELEHVDPPATPFDAVTSMGVIGYLPTDEVLFRLANNFLKDGGLFLVSCRNRLFNMVSLTHRTTKEIEAGEGPALIKELQTLYHDIPTEDGDALLRHFKELSAAQLDCVKNGGAMSPAKPLRTKQDLGAAPIEPRQHTPARLVETAAQFGFTSRSLFGVHPHLLDPNVNRLFPPHLFNRLSDCLLALEHLPISLVWSSVFIAVFEKTGDLDPRSNPDAAPRRESEI